MMTMTKPVADSKPTVKYFANLIICLFMLQSLMYGDRLDRPQEFDLGHVGLEGIYEPMDPLEVFGRDLELWVSDSRPFMVDTTGLTENQFLSSVGTPSILFCPELFDDRPELARSEREFSDHLEVATLTKRAVFESGFRALPAKPSAHTISPFDLVHFAGSFSTRLANRHGAISSWFVTIGAQSIYDSPLSIKSGSAIHIVSTSFAVAFICSFPAKHPALQALAFAFPFFSVQALLLSQLGGATFAVSACSVFASGALAMDAKASRDGFPIIRTFCVIRSSDLVCHRCVMLMTHRTQVNYPTSPLPEWFGQEVKYVGPDPDLHQEKRWQRVRESDEGLCRKKKYLGCGLTRRLVMKNLNIGGTLDRVQTTTDAKKLWIFARESDKGVSKETVMRSDLMGDHERLAETSSPVLV